MPIDEMMPRVVFINPWDKRIGPNRYLVELLRASPVLARNSTVVLPEQDEAAEEYRTIGCRIEIWSDARLVHVGLSVTNAWRLLRVHSLGVLRAYRRLRALRAQIVLTNSENVWFGGMAARLLGVPHLQVFHALTLEYNWGNRSWLVRGYVRWLSLWNACFIAVSQAVVKMLMRNGVADLRIALIPNSLNLLSIAEASPMPLPARIEELVRSHRPILISFGRISHLKGHDLLIETFARVKANFPDALLLCAGALLSDEGLDDTHSFNRRLQERMRELGISESIVFLGEIDYAIALLRRADVYVQPSRSESFCRAIAEAALCRIPVVAFDVGGIPEVLGPQGGLLVTPENPAALADAINRLLGDSGLWQSCVESAYQHVVECFNVRQIIQSFERLLRDTVYSNQ